MGSLEVLYHRFNVKSPFPEISVAVIAVFLFIAHDLCMFDALDSEVMEISTY